MASRRTTKLTADDRMPSSDGLAEDKNVTDNRVAPAIGIQGKIKLESSQIEYKPDDLFLLFSGEICKTLSDEDIARIAKKKNRDDVEGTAQEIIKKCTETRSEDDLSLVLVKVEEENIAVVSNEKQTSSPVLKIAAAVILLIIGCLCLALFLQSPSQNVDLEGQHDAELSSKPLENEIAQDR